MTNSSRKILLALFLATPALASAQTQPVAKPAPAAAAPRPVAPAAAPRPMARPAAAAPAARPRVIQNTPTQSEQWQRQVDRQQLQNRQQQNSVQQQLRQSNNTMQRNNATDPALQKQLDSANRGQQDSYRARQDAATQQYQAQPQNNGTAPPGR